MTNSEIIDDFRRRYEGTYVWLRNEATKKESLVQVESIHHSNSKIGILNLYFIESDSLLKLNIGSKGYKLLFKYPPVGVFQFGPDAFMFRRLPARQYRRGICSDNSLLANITRLVVGNKARWNPKEVKAAFEHKTFGQKAALAMIKTKKYRSVAMDNNLSLCKSIDQDFESNILFHWDHPIARISFDGRITKVLEPHYTEFLIGEWDVN